jgi:hypothetical protein
MAGGAVAARAVDLFKDNAAIKERQARAAVFFGDERRQPAGLSP